MTSKRLISDLVSASIDQLEPLPGDQSLLKDEVVHNEEWLEDLTEKADRAHADPEIQFAVGQYHFLRGNYQLALSYFEKAARVGNTEQNVDSTAFSIQAKYQLGVMYYDGLGVEENTAKGSEFMLDVAKSKQIKDLNVISSAQYNMGRAYFMGFGVPQSDSKAAEWWHSAATLENDASSIRAKHLLGLFYSREETLDPTESFQWHYQAAECGNLESMAVVGVLMTRGYGCVQNEIEGLQWLKKSSEADSMYGAGLLSRHYFTKKLFSKAADTAFKVSEIEFKPSLSQFDQVGVATGCFIRGRCLHLGQGVLRNESKAMQYYAKAKKFNKKVVEEMHNLLIHGKL